MWTWNIMALLTKTSRTKVNDINFYSATSDYSHLSGVIEQVVHNKIHRYYVPDMSPDDIAQEIRIKCVAAMEKFDATRIGPNPYQFLSKVADNHLYNFSRGTWVPNNPPCNRCPLWDIGKKVCKVNEVDCDKIVKYRKKMFAKAALRTATEFPDYAQEAHVDTLEASILHEHFKSKLPKKLLPYYEKLINGEKIPSNYKSKIRSIIRTMLHEEI